MPAGLKLMRVQDSLKLLVEVFLFVLGLFLLLFPRSPLSIGMLRNFGPRTDVENLTRTEIWTNTKGFLSIALIFLLLTLGAILVFKLSNPPPRSNLTPYFAAIALPGICLAISGMAALVSLCHWLFRRTRHNDALIRARLSHIDIPERFEGATLRMWLRDQKIRVPAPPPSRQGAKGRFGEQAHLQLTIMGLAIMLGGLGLLCLFFFGVENRREPADWAVAGILAVWIGIGALLTWAGITVDRRRPR